MNLLTNPMRLAAVAAWLAALIGLACIGSQPVILLVGILVICAVAAAVLRLMRRRAHRQTARALAISAGAMVLVLGSLAVQTSMNAGAIEQLGSKAYFSDASVRLELLDDPTPAGQATSAGQWPAGSTYQAHVRLVEFDGKRIPCGLGSINCAPRGQLRISSSAGSANLPKAGEIIVGEGLIKPGQGRDAFGIRLSSWQQESQQRVWSPIAQLRDGFKRNLVGVTPEAKALVAGLAIGAVDQMPAALRADMQVTGLTHLTAVSGSNCAIVIGLVWWLLSRSRLGRRQRLVTSGAALLGYVLLVGQQPSVLRAAVMLGAVMLGRYVGRGIQALDALSAAIVVLLLCDPWLATDLGFLLSALATAGLVLLTKPITERLDASRTAQRILPPKLRLALAVVLAAQVMCLPVIIGLSKALPLYTLPANLLAEPLVAPITVLGMAAVATAPVPWLSSGICWLASVPAQAIVWIATGFATAPGAAWPWPRGFVGITAATLISLAILTLLLSRRMRRASWIALAALSAACLAFGFAKPLAATAWPISAADVVMCDVGQGDAMVIRSEGAVAVVDVGREPKAVDTCLTRLGVQRIDLLVLTHFDMDHVGGITGAIDRRAIDTVLETPWPDTRPTVGFIDREVGGTQARVVFAQTGLSGHLGGLRWRVVSPSKTASEAEDSNDGSVILSFESADYNLLALADLGERGQMRLVEQYPDLVRELTRKPLILKVAHHGSADLYPELYEALKPAVALIGVGIENGYGHPTKRALEALNAPETKIYRTDRDGSIAVRVEPSTTANTPAVITVAVSGGG